MKKNPRFIFISLIILSTFLSIRPVWATHSILLLGDSLSASYGMKQNEGWVYLLNKKFSEQKTPISIINASISGETTAGGLSRVDRLLNQHDAKFLVIELGGNDGLRGFSTKLIKNNLLQIIEKAQQKNLKVALIKMRITPNYGKRYNKMFEQIFIDLAQEKNILLLPFFMEKVIVDTSLMQNDGIHPNQKAQPLIASIVEPQLKQLIDFERSK
jgi:acyl-CoA thioesterase-1